MSLPVYNFALNVSTNIAICAIFPPGSVVAGLTLGTPKIFPASGQNQDPMLDLVSYYISAGSTGVGTVVTFQELGGDGTWRPLVNPAPITLASSTNYNPGASAAVTFSPGPYHALRLSVSGVVGNGVAFAELKATVRDK